MPGRPILHQPALPEVRQRWSAGELAGRQQGAGCWHDWSWSCQDGRYSSSQHCQKCARDGAPESSPGGRRVPDAGMTGAGHARTADPPAASTATSAPEMERPSAGRAEGCRMLACLELVAPGRPILQQPALPEVHQRWSARVLAGPKGAGCWHAWSWSHQDGRSSSSQHCQKCTRDGAPECWPGRRVPDAGMPGAGRTRTADPPAASTARSAPEIERPSAGRAEGCRMLACLELVAPGRPILQQPALPEVHQRRSAGELGQKGARCWHDWSWWCQDGLGLRCGRSEGTREGPKGIALWEFGVRDGFKAFDKECQEVVEDLYQAFLAGGERLGKVPMGKLTVFVDFIDMKQRVGHAGARERPVRRRLL
ncbi:unnamed protein product [Effrenium voratum]|uniref:WWE domain-containing protein n=1 Tax=Effrenium voratum TaxID=2562239 RepID=A0AA36J3X5_9DINO|nr:unnamed protein product [Effrenium voratum]